MADRGVILVTGASRGLGRSIAEHLANKGFIVIAGVRREEDANALICAGTGDLRPLLLDVTNARSIADTEARVREATADCGLAGLVNNAAVFLMGPFEQTPLSAVDSLFDVNVKGVIAMTQRFLPLLRRNHGRIVNVSSVNGRLSFPYSSFYSASKYALEGLSDALRVELRPWGIEVVIVEPGVTHTDIRMQGAQGWTALRESMTIADRALYEAPYLAIQRLLPQVEAGAADHSYVAAAVFQALTANPPATRYLAGPDTAHWMEMAVMPDRNRDDTFAAMFGA